MNDPNVIFALRRVEAYIATAEARGVPAVTVLVEDLRDCAVAMRRLGARNSFSTTEREEP